jgi:SAM-dependent methyltransferase
MPAKTRHTAGTSLRTSTPVTLVSSGLPQIVVVEAKERSTNLQPGCCSAIYMRNVLHHIDDWRAYADDLRRTVRPGGIVAIIDFAPGAMFLLARDRGAPPDRVIETFTAAGFRIERRVDDWGGKTYLLAFRSPQRALRGRSPAVLSSARYAQSPPVVGRLCGRRGGVHCQCAAGDSDASLRFRVRAVRRTQTCEL